LLTTCWLDSGRMRSLSAPQPKIRKLDAVRPCRVLKGPPASKACSFSLYSQAQKTCDDYDHDHHTDDVKDVHCVLLRVRDANPLEGWQICDWVHPGSSCHGCQSVVEATMHSSTNVSLLELLTAIFCGLSLFASFKTGPLSDHAIIQSAAVYTKSLARGPALGQLQ
jgi:hypothetical protein